MIGKKFPNLQVKYKDEKPKNQAKKRLRLFLSA